MRLYDFMVLAVMVLDVLCAYLCGFRCLGFDY